MENRELHPNLQAALQLVEGIFQMLGSRYEVILHDLSHVESSIVALAGDVTHRKIGGPVTNYLLQLLQKYGDSAPNSINYRNVTTDGRILRSSTIFIRDENGHIVLEKQNSVRKRVYPRVPLPKLQKVRNYPRAA